MPLPQDKENKENKVNSLPDQLSLLQLISLIEGRLVKKSEPIERVEKLPIQAYWQKSKAAQTAAWPKVSLGVIEGMKPYEMTFSADSHGVHGMIAGTTGAGKSELLLTLILSLAVHYDPSIVNFVLIDYQGGAAFEPFRQLPHCVDVVTSMQGIAGMRTFLALHAELKRRSRIITEARVKHIVQYRMKNLHVTREPMPHIFVIIDEFAEMLRDIPQAGKHLDSIARLGRALGVHLILATQRPGGVVSEQIRANMGFKIALRVQAPEDSLALLRTYDAAYLPANKPGRAYLQASGEHLVTLQTAYSSAPYSPGKSKLTTQQLLDTPPLNEVIIDTLAKLAVEHDVPKQRKPWPDPLPNAFTLETESLDDEPNALLPLNPAVVNWQHGEGRWTGIDWHKNIVRTNIGLVDYPAKAKQDVANLDLTRGHGLILGGPGRGKTNLLRTAILGLASTHTPDELNIYIMDFGERGLKLLRELPQVAAYMNVSEGERIRRLLHKLTRIQDDRKLILSDAQVDNIYHYNATHPQATVPSVVVVIDNFIELKEAFHDVESIMNTLVQLLRTGRTLGIHFLITATMTGDIPSKFFRLFSEHNTFFLGDSIFTDYHLGFSRSSQNWERPRETIQNHGRDVTLLPGRGFAQIEGIPLEFHAALPVHEEQSEGDDSRKLTLIAQTMREAWHGEEPRGIDILPTRIFLKHILPEQVVDGIPAILGLADTDLEPAMINLRSEAPHFVVIGPPMSGKTTALRSLIMSLAHCNPVDKVAMVLVDFRRRLQRYGGEHTLAQLPHILETVSDAEHLKQVIENLKFEYQGNTAHLKRDIFVVIDNYDDLWMNMYGPSRAGSFQAELGELARRYSSEGLHLVIGGPISIARSSDEVMKTVLASRYGLGLDTDDAPSALGGRVRLHNSRYSNSYSSYFDSSTRFSAGRGFIVKSGNASLVQVASPYESDDPEGSLDTWINEIVSRNPQRARWYRDVSR